MTYHTNTKLALQLTSSLASSSRQCTCIIGFVNGSVMILFWIYLFIRSQCCPKIIYTNYSRIRKAEGKKKEGFPIKPNTVSRSNAWFLITLLCNIKFIVSVLNNFIYRLTFFRVHSFYAMLSRIHNPCTCTTDVQSVLRWFFVHLKFLDRWVGQQKDVQSYYYTITLIKRDKSLSHL